MTKDIGNKRWRILSTTAGLIVSLAVVGGGISFASQTRTQPDTSRGDQQCAGATQPAPTYDPSNPVTYGRTGDRSGRHGRPDRPDHHDRSGRPTSTGPTCLSPCPPTPPSAEPSVPPPAEPTGLMCLSPCPQTPPSGEPSVPPSGEPSVPPSGEPSIPPSDAPAPSIDNGQGPDSTATTGCTSPPCGVGVGVGGGQASGQPNTPSGNSGTPGPSGFQNAGPQIIGMPVQHGDHGAGQPDARTPCKPPCLGTPGNGQPSNSLPASAPTAGPSATSKDQANAGDQDAGQPNATANPVPPSGADAGGCQIPKVETRR
jgi:hypothetical protein